MVLTALLLMAAAPSPPDLSTSAACKAARQHPDRVAMIGACIPLKPRRVYEGVWYDTFEGQEFFDRAMTAAVVSAPHPRVWLEIDRRDALALANLLERIPEIRTPRSYRVRFLGAETLFMNCHARDSFGWPSCYGHEGAFPGMVVVERMLSIDAL